MGRSYFDKEFSEDDFIQGARQGIHSGRQLYHQNLNNKSALVVDHDDFLNISMSDIGFEYGDEGQKWAYVLVVCFCRAKESVAKTFGSIDVITNPTRMLKYSFRREYTPGIGSGW